MGKDSPAARRQALVGKASAITLRVTDRPRLRGPIRHTSRSGQRVAYGRLGREWLLVDHVARAMEWSTHCNTEVARWTVRERGVTLSGPALRTWLPAAPPEALRTRMRLDLPTLLDDLETWLTFDTGWGQRYAVATTCRMLYTLRRAEVASKRAALEWARGSLDARWVPLLDQVLADRERGLDHHDPPRPGGVEQAYAFAAYGAELAARW